MDVDDKINRRIECIKLIFRVIKMNKLIETIKKPFVYMIYFLVEKVGYENPKDYGYWQALTNLYGNLFEWAKERWWTMKQNKQKISKSEIDLLIGLVCLEAVKDILVKEINRFIEKDETAQRAILKTLLMLKEEMENEQEKAY